MAIRGAIIDRLQIPMDGVNLALPENELLPTEARWLENTVIRQGRRKRFGNSFLKQLLTTVRPSGLLYTELAPNGKGLLIIGFGANNSFFFTDLTSAGGFTTLTNSYNATGLASIEEWAITGKVYITKLNPGTTNSAPHVYAGGTSVTPLTGTNIRPYRQVKGYRDRLFGYIKDKEQIYWTKTASDSVWVADSASINTARVAAGGGITGMSVHGFGTSAKEAVDTNLLFTTRSGIWMLSGTQFGAISDVDGSLTGTTDFVLTQVSDRVGVGNDFALTIVATPRGTIFWGTDGNFYLMPFGRGEPIPIGGKVWISLDNSFPSPQDTYKSLTNNPYVFATYHDGYYKLIMGEHGGTNPTRRQWWLDITQIRQDARGQYGPWIGPMTGLKQDGLVQEPGKDSWAVEGDGTRIRVLKANDSSTFQDDGTAISSTIRQRVTRAPEATLSWIPQVELAGSPANAAPTLRVIDHDGSSSGPDSITFSGGQGTWTPATDILMRRPVLEIAHSSPTDFQVNRVDVMLQPRRQSFGHKP